jgi:hypothetical protein
VVVEKVVEVEEVVVVGVEQSAPLQAVRMHTRISSAITLLVLVDGAIPEMRLDEFASRHELHDLISRHDEAARSGCSVACACAALGALVRASAGLASAALLVGVCCSSAAHLRSSAFASASSSSTLLPAHDDPKASGTPNVSALLLQSFACAVIKPFSPFASAPCSLVRLDP